MSALVADIATGPNNVISLALLKGIKLTDILKNEGDSWGLGSGKYNSISLKRVKRLKTKKLRPESLTSVEGKSWKL